MNLKEHPQVPFPCNTAPCTNTTRWKPRSTRLLPSLHLFTACGVGGHCRHHHGHNMLCEAVLALHTETHSTHTRTASLDATSMAPRLATWDWVVCLCVKVNTGTRFHVAAGTPAGLRRWCYPLRQGGPFVVDQVGDACLRKLTAGELPSAMEVVDASRVLHPTGPQHCFEDPHHGTLGANIIHSRVTSLAPLCARSPHLRLVNKTVLISIYCSRDSNNSYVFTPYSNLIVDVHATLVLVERGERF